LALSRASTFSRYFLSCFVHGFNESGKFRAQPTGLNGMGLRQYMDQYYRGAGLKGYGLDIAHGRSTCLGSIKGRKDTLENRLPVPVHFPYLFAMYTEHRYRSPGNHLFKYAAQPPSANAADPVRGHNYEVRMVPA